MEYQHMAWTNYVRQSEITRSIERSQRSIHISQSSNHRSQSSILHRSQSSIPRSQSSIHRSQSSSRGHHRATLRSEVHRSWSNSAWGERLQRRFVPCELLLLAFARKELLNGVSATDSECYDGTWIFIRDAVRAKGGYDNSLRDFTYHNHSSCHNVHGNPQLV